MCSKLVSLLALALAVGLSGCAIPKPVQPDEPSTAAGPEIRWDRWGVPHISGASQAEVLYGFGWAQARAHANLIVELYGKARGRGAEYWGETHLERDVLIRTLDIPARAQRWLADHPPAARDVLQAFADGINAYLVAHPEALAEDKRQVLPITAVDVLAHLQVAIHMTFVAWDELPKIEKWREGNAELASVGPANNQPGSNAWALGPARTAAGTTMLLANPHLPWDDLFLFFEAQLTGGGVNAYGAALVGMPVLVVAFNEQLGWTHTVNTYDGADLYELEVEDGGYRFDGEVRAFKQRHEVFKVRTEAGEMRSEARSLRASVHGPVVVEREDGSRALALRVAGLESGRLLEQYWAMLGASTLGEFQAAVATMQMPMFNVVYADRHGEIYYAYNARQPRRSGGDPAAWVEILDGEDRSALWTDYWAFDELPAYANPPSGWIHNANDPPWTSTAPPALKADAYPAYLSPSLMSPRAQQSAMLLDSAGKTTLADFVALAGTRTIHAATETVPLLVAAAEGSDDALIRRAAAVLAEWDHRAVADSRGAALFAAYMDEVRKAGKYRDLFAEAWRPAAPLAAPTRLADPDQALALLRAAAQTLVTHHGAVDVPYGEVHRVRYAGQDRAANLGECGDGGFWCGWFGASDAAGHRKLQGGATYITATEFGERVRARGLLAYGNATQPGSPWIGDQLELFGRGELRELYFYPEDVAANTVERVQLRIER